MSRPAAILSQLAGMREDTDALCSSLAREVLPASDNRLRMDTPFDALRPDGEGRALQPPSGGDAEPGHDVLTADEVAAFLRCDRKTVYEAVALRQIPHQKLGRKILFSRIALLEWLSCKGSSERDRY